MKIDVSWERKPVYDGVKHQTVDQWSVTASKQLGPHLFSETLTCQQYGAPPIIICRDLEHRAVRKVEHDIMFSRHLAAEGMSETG